MLSLGILTIMKLIAIINTIYYIFSVLLKQTDGFIKLYQQICVILYNLYWYLKTCYHIDINIDNNTLVFTVI